MALLSTIPQCGTCLVIWESGQGPCLVLAGGSHLETAITGEADVNESNIQILGGLVGILGNFATSQKGQELVPSSQIYVTHQQLQDLSQVSTDKREVMMPVGLLPFV